MAVIDPPSDDGPEYRPTAINLWAQRKLEGLRAERASPQAVAQPKASSKRRAKRSKARGGKKTMLMEAAAMSEVNRLVTREAQANGDYQFVPFIDVEVTEGGRRVKKEQRVVRNFGGSTIERWHGRGVFEERQLQAILFYQDAYRKVFGEGPKVTANYSPVIIRGLKASVELWAGSTMAAREALRLLDHEVFLNERFDDFCVWQNVTIWGKAAGVAGAGVGFVVKKSAEAAARTIVCGIAHKVANVVIDQSRRDFGDLLIDLDAPRRSGRRSA